MAELCRITAEPIDHSALIEAVADRSDGAVLLFLGIVRDHHQGRSVADLEYDAYAPMALAELQAIVAEARGRWPVGRIGAVHRVGRLEIGEVSVAIAVASPHRAEAYDASRYVIEELKRRLPVWKRERYTEGDSRWLDGVRPEEGAGGDRSVTAEAGEALAIPDRGQPPADPARGEANERRSV